MFSKIKKTIQAVQLFFLMRKFKGMVMCSDKYIQELADKIGYGAQLALYELHTEQQGDMTWDSKGDDSLNSHWPRCRRPIW